MGANIIDIFKYFGNVDFERVNRDRVFIMQEMLSIMVHSKVVPIEEKIADMRTLLRCASGNVRSNIEAYIDNESNKLAVINGLHGDDIAFNAVKYDIVGKHTYKYNSLSELLDNGGADGLVLVFKATAEGKKMQNIASLDMRGRDIISTSVCSTNYTNKGAELGAYKVRIKSPFKPYDILEIAGKASIKHIIAPIGGSTLESIREEGKLYESDGWLDIAVPVYVDNGSGGYDLEVATGLPWAIDEIRRVSADRLTIRDMMNIEAIKDSVGD